MAAGVAGGVDHLDRHRRVPGQHDPLAVRELAVHLETAGGDALRGQGMGEDRHAERLPQAGHAADVVGVVVGEPDGRDAPAELLAGHCQRALQALVLGVHRRAGIDQHRVPEAQEIDVGRRRRRERVGGEREHQHPGTHLDAAERPEVGLGGVAQAAQGGARFRCAQGIQDVQDRRRHEHVAAVPGLPGRGRVDPPARLELAGQDRGLDRLALRPLQQEEAVVEAHRRERRRHPAAGPDQARGVDRGAQLPQDLGEVELAVEKLVAQAVRLGRRGGRRGEQEAEPPRTARGPRRRGARG